MVVDFLSTFLIWTHRSPETCLLQMKKALLSEGLAKNGCWVIQESRKLRSKLQITIWGKISALKAYDRSGHLIRASPYLATHISPFSLNNRNSCRACSIACRPVHPQNVPASACNFSFMITGSSISGITSHGPQLSKTSRSI